MNKIKLLWVLLTTSKGMKRNVGIVLYAAGYLAAKAGVELPANFSEETITALFQWLGGGLAFVGVVHSLWDSFTKKTK